MTVTDILAIIGAVTGIVGTTLGIAALGWDFYKWRYSERVKLRITATPGFITTDNPNQEMIFVSIANIGKVPTTIKLITVQGFESKKALKKRHAQKVAVIRQVLYNQLPARLDPGNDWVGGINQDYQLKQFLEYEYFIVSVEDTMSDWPFRAIVDKNLIKRLNP